MKEKTIVITLGLLPFLMVLGNSMLIPILPTIQSALVLSNFQTGLVLSAFSIPAAILIPLIGIISDRYGRKRIIIISLVTMILGSICAAFSGFISSNQTAFHVLITGRVIQGVGAAGTTTLAMALTGDLFQNEQRSKVLGILEVYNGVGKVISPIIGATAAILNWYSAFFVYPVVAVIALIGLLLYVRESIEGKDTLSVPTYIKKVTGVWKREQDWLLPLFFVGGLGLFLLFGTLYYLSFLIEETYHIDGFFKGTAFLFPLGAMTITSYWTGKKIKNNHLHMNKLMILGFSLLLVMFLLLIFFHTLAFIMLFLTIAFAGLGFILPCANMLITSSVKDEERGFMVSLYGTVRFLGVALGPIVFAKWMKDEERMFTNSFFLLLFAGVWVGYKMNLFKVIRAFRSSETKR
ncbi:MFS transporter [Metabacillus iocasae]|uniref:ACDE family multidrug resistance protein n=1 Tax=Priestia iocasae TaxID=2291674 RepID=A0ABS2QQ31_9BACI|nr:MFS transporter [Metabacillus iocasae]MBM7701510.1 ACDE family multidrug resistance protein [Metabacillus iocasae]